MNWQDLWLRLRALITRMRVDRELDEELQFHLAMQVKKNLAAGLTPEEARRRARVEFGGVDQVKEECRDARGVRWIEEFFQDIRYAARTLRRSPMFASVAILSLALGIGANTAIFSLIDTVMLRMMPVEEPERLVQFTKFYGGRQSGYLSYPLFERLRDQNRSLTGVFARASVGRSEINFGREPELAETEVVSGSYYSVLGVKAILGRVFGQAEDRTGDASPVAVISYRYWKRRFASDPAVVGKTFRLNGTVVSIIGVTPREFFGVVVGHIPDITFPMVMDAQVRGEESWRVQGFNWLSIMARLKPGIPLRQAQADVTVLFEQPLQEQAAKTSDPREKKELLDQHLKLEPAGNGFAELRTEYSQPLLILMSVVGLVLCIACSNLANLLLARAATRRREISIRMSIGASRARMIRQMLTESLLLSALGGAVSIALAVWFSNLMIRLMANGGAPLAIEIRPDLRVIGFTAAIGMITCLFFGLAPALQATQINLSPGLKETAVTARRRLSKGLVVVQIALALMLTAGAGLFLRTLLNFYTLDVGFKPNGVLLFGVNARKAGYKDKRFRALQAQILDRLNSLPGVRSASLSGLPPISGGEWGGVAEVEGYTHRPDEDNQQNFNVAGPKFFQTAGTAVLMGREFNERDVPSAPLVAIVNETFARYYFAGRSPIGKHITVQEKLRVEIVGVVKDMKYRSLRQEFPRTIYFAALQDVGPSFATYLVRTAGSPGAFTHSVEQALREIDPVLRVSDVVTLAEHMDRSIFKERIMAGLASIFGLLAIAVACLGVYGTMAFQVVRRTNEIGIRIALGAQRGDLIWMIQREITILLAFGITGGLLGALATTRLTEALLFQVKPADPATFVLAAAICCILVVAAGYVPARRASRVDPIAALRCE